MVIFDKGGSVRKGKTYPPETLERAEIEDILATCTKGPIAARDHALITLFWRSGLRHAEALALVPHNVSAGKVDVQHGKGDKRRVVGMDARTEQSMKAWKAERGKLKVPAGSPLFCSVRHTLGKPLQQRDVRRMLSARAKRAGVLKRITPHALRHALAVELMNEGTPLAAIQQVLGHSSAATTNAYLATINPVLGINALQSRD